jgi:zinc D-Ala-D-Ala carboxypeptidase
VPINNVSYDDFMKNVQSLLTALDQVREKYGKPMKINSGLRTYESNKKAGGSKNSWHLYGLAVDISDIDGALYKFCQENIGLLESTGLYCEVREATPTWVHFQIRAPRSNKRFFKP